MGQKAGDGLGALALVTAEGGDTQDLDIAARLAIVQSRLDGEGTTNSNIEDTPDKRARHGFWLDGRVRAA